MVGYALYFLIFLMPFSGHKYHVAFLCHHARLTDGGTAVLYANHMLLLTFFEPRQQILEDGLLTFITWVVACEYHIVALSHRLPGHLGSFALVTVATSTAYGDDPAALASHFVYGHQHLLQAVGGMGIIDKGNKTLRRKDGVEPAFHSRHLRQHGENVFWLLAKHHGSAIAGKQVADVEASEKTDMHLTTVDVQPHAIEVAIQQTSREVGLAVDGIIFHRSFAVAHHHTTILVVGVDDCKRAGRQQVEKRLLRIAVFGKSVVVVEMVTCQIGEDAAGEMKTIDALLGQTLTRALHEHILTTSFQHSRHQAVEFTGTRGGDDWWQFLVVNADAYGGYETTMVAHLAEHIKQNRGDGGLAVGAGHSH